MSDSFNELGYDLKFAISSCSADLLPSQYRTRNERAEDLSNYYSDYSKKTWPTDKRVYQTNGENEPHRFCCQGLKLPEPIVISVR